MITVFDLAQRFIGVKEAPGSPSNPMVLAMLKLDQTWPPGDEVPWCSAFANFICWLARLPRSKDLRARSWLRVGIPVAIENAVPGRDVVILTRAGSKAGPDVIDAPGHVGFYAGREGDHVVVLGGNQGDQVSLARFPVKQILGLRRLT